MTANIWIKVFQWLIRVYGGLLLGVILLFMVFEGGLPNPLCQPLPVRVEMFGMLVMIVGLIVGWWKQGFGGLLIFCGIMAFHIVEKKILLGGLFPFYDIAAILYLISWWLRDMLDLGETAT